ncbi:peptide chain release factor N(5)-glutamine methyltransferase [Eubacteriaceae bacterium ES3]|nr:peptide chain release factor N(5)-glutamine methyltransferase [Eubacteriaceae bacterium ES3]
MTVGEILKEARQILMKAGIENCGFEAEVLASQVFKKDRVFFYTHNDAQVTEEEKVAYLSLTKRRAAHEPVAYILKNKEFMGLNFYVDKNVLIPRPDTEPMVEALINWLKEKETDNIKVLDLCTGSGAIGICLKSFCPQIEIALSDYSEVALEVAGKNAKDLVAGNVKLYWSDLFENIPAEEEFDLIVSNPPYIPTGDIKKLSQDITEYEPGMALDGGESGLVFYRRITDEADKFLKPGGLLALEIGDHQEEDVTELLKGKGFCEIESICDLTGLVRAITAKNPGSS